jgi:hypothetical protein
MEDLREKLESALKAHDWFYPMSEDPRAYRRGREAWERIQFLASQLDDGQELIAKYRKPIH